MTRRLTLPSTPVALTETHRGCLDTGKVVIGRQHTRAPAVLGRDAERLQSMLLDKTRPPLSVIWGYVMLCLTWR